MNQQIKKRIDDIETIILRSAGNTEICEIMTEIAATIREGDLAAQDDPNYEGYTDEISNLIEKLKKY